MSMRLHSLLCRGAHAGIARATDALFRSASGAGVAAAWAPFLPATLAALGSALQTYGADPPGNAPDLEAYSALRAVISHLLSAPPEWRAGVREALPLPADLGLEQESAAIATARDRQTTLDAVEAYARIAPSLPQHTRTAAARHLTTWWTTRGGGGGCGDGATVGTGQPVLAQSASVGRMQGMGVDEVEGSARVADVAWRIARLAHDFQDDDMKVRE